MKLLQICGIIIMAGVLIAGTHGPGNCTELTDAEMASLIGGDGCKDCAYTGLRKDECYHTNSFFSSCSTTQCIANYLIGDSCVLGTGTCSSYRDPSAASYVQYIRQDPNCSNVNPNWSTWTTSYYSSFCNAVVHQVKCIKATNSCNGTLVNTITIYNGIVCL